MWLVFSILSALFASLTTIFAKIGLKNINSNLASLLRSIVILIIIGLIMTVNKTNISLDVKTLLFLILSSITTALAWLAYFRAIQLTEVKNVSPIDKLSTVITIILSFIILKESINFLALILITLGILIMMEKKYGKYIYYALLAALFSSITAIFAKIGIINTNPQFATLIKTTIVILFSFCLIFFKKEYKDIKKIDFKSFIYILLSGIATCISWIMFYKGLKLADVSKVTSIEKLNIVFTIILSHFILKEHVKKREIIGLFIIVIGTLILIK